MFDTFIKHGFLPIKSDSTYLDTMYLNNFLRFQFCKICYFENHLAIALPLDQAVDSQV